MRRFIKHLLLALCLLIPVTSAAVVTAATPAFADHDGDHSGYNCYYYENLEWFTYYDAGSARYYTDYYGVYYECYDYSSGLYYATRVGESNYSYWVYND